MKKIFALLILAALAVPANADEFSVCKRWVDEKGFEMVECDLSKLPSSMPPLKREYKTPTSVTVTPINSVGSFTIHDHTNDITRLCYKSLSGRVDCR